MESKLTRPENGIRNMQDYFTALKNEQARFLEECEKVKSCDWSMRSRIRDISHVFLKDSIACIIIGYDVGIQFFKDLKAKKEITDMLDINRYIRRDLFKYNSVVVEKLHNEREMKHTEYCRILKSLDPRQIFMCKQNWEVALWTGPANYNTQSDNIAAHCRGETEEPEHARWIYPYKV
ncbi:MAG: hypothetical protein Q8P11_01195 [bacterium]|nr:hypothetical protein [bacterium]